MPGARALREAVFRASPVGKLVTALEGGILFREGGALKMEPIETVLEVVTFDGSKIEFKVDDEGGIS